MNLRFILPVHPRTGLQAIGWCKRGPIWPIMGASSDHVGEGEGEGEEGGDNTEEEEKKEEAKPKEESYTAEEYNSLKERMRAADKNSSALRKELEALKTKDMPEAEKLKAQHKEVTQERDTYLNELKAARRELAFFKSNEYEWYDPEDALRLADLSSVEISEDGSVDIKALKAALKELAKKKPHLVKTKSGEGEKEETNSVKSASTPEVTGNRKGSTKAKPTREDLAKRFPALRGR